MAVKQSFLGIDQEEIDVSLAKPLPVTDSRWQTEIGNVEGQTLLDVGGVNANIGFTYEDISDVGGDQTLPVEGAPEEWEIVSTSADDDNGGSGTESVSVGRLLDGWVDAPDVLATVTGLAPNLIPGGAVNFRPKQALILTPAGGTNVGDIIIRVAGGGAERIKILAGEGVSKSSLFSVAVNTTAFAQFIIPATGKGRDAEVRSQIQVSGGPIIVGGGLPVYQNSIPIPIVAPFTLPEKTDLKIQAKSENTGTKVIIFIDFLIIDNDFIQNPITIARNIL